MGNYRKVNCKKSSKFDHDQKREQREHNLGTHQQRHNLLKCTHLQASARSTFRRNPTSEHVINVQHLNTQHQVHASTWSMFQRNPTSEHVSNHHIYTAVSYNASLELQRISNLSTARKLLNTTSKHQQSAHQDALVSRSLGRVF